MKTLIKTAGAASLLALGVTNANAGVLLPELFFSQNAGFLNPVVEFNEGTLTQGDFTGDLTGTGAPDDTFSKFDWYGTDSDTRSSISIESYTDSDSPDTENPLLGGAPLKLNSDLTAADGSTDEWNLGDWWVIDTLTQTNNALTSIPGEDNQSPLWIIDALANLRIYSDDTRTTELFSDLGSLTRISFTETVNTAGVGGCGSNETGGPPCEDVFTVLAADLDPVTFNHDGYKYSINFTLLPGVSTNAAGDLASAQSALVENPDGTISVYTPEFNPGTSSIHVLAQYTATKIPEPAILGLFSVGMLGLGMAARRRRKPA